MKRVILILLLAFCLAGCGQRGAWSKLRGGRGGAPPLLLSPPEEGKAARAAERLFREGQFGYRLKKPVPISRSDQSLLLRYRAADGERSLRVFGPDGRELARRPLPAAPGSTLFLYTPLPTGSRLQGFEILPGPGCNADGLQLLGAELAGSFTGAAVYPGELHLGVLVSSLAADGRALELRFSLPPAGQAAKANAAAAGAPAAATASAPASSLGGGSLWQIELQFESLKPVPPALLRRLEGEDATLRARPGLAQVALTFSGRGQSRSFRHSALSGKQRLLIYAGLLPFLPESLRIEPLAGGQVWLEHLALARIASGTDPASAGGGGLPGALEPLAADPGAVLHYDPARWRQKEYELFCWQRYPQVLIMDTADYEVQSRFFKRLAFFVEKRGYRGRLLADREFAALHGFNAHDYRAEDLARFFQAAREQSFPLNQEERLLERILLANGVIREQGAILAGRGAILSVSRASNAQLRQHLLTHECLHGLFFSLNDFRRAAFEAWEQISEEARAYWELFFRWVGYDTEDTYLAVNEFQAYLLQQPREGVDYYFRSLTSGRLIGSYPDREQGIRRFLAAEPAAFLESFDRLEQALRDLAGLEAGRVVELQPLPAVTSK